MGIGPETVPGVALSKDISPFVVDKAYIVSGLNIIAAELGFPNRPTVPVVNRKTVSRVNIQTDGSRNFEWFI